MHLKGHDTSEKEKIYDTKRGNKFYSACARQPLHHPCRSPGEEGRRKGCQPPSKHRVDLSGMPSSSRRYHQGCFSLASSGTKGRACGRWQRCPAAASGPRASGQGAGLGELRPSNLGRTGGEKSVCRERERRCEPAPGRALQPSGRGDGAEAGRQGTKAGRAEGERGAQGPRARRQRGRTTPSRGSKDAQGEIPRLRACRSRAVGAVATCRAEEGTGTWDRRSVVPPQECSTASPLAQLLARHLLAGALMFPRQPPTANLALTI